MFIIVITKLNGKYINHNIDLHWVMFMSDCHINTQDHMTTILDTQT